MDVGDTVSLRVAASGGLRELVGTLLARTAETLTIRRRDGELDTVRLTDIRHGRVVPPPPAATIETGELAQVTAQGWRALETEPLGEWLLRASGGFTGRGNSVLPVGDPGRPLDDALDAVERWYAARGLPAKVQLLDRGVDPRLAAALDARGWDAAPCTWVMTAELGPVLRGVPERDGLVRLDGRPDDAWLARYRHELPGRVQGALPDPALRLLVDHDRVAFASVRDGEACLAIGRVAVDGRWAGVFGVEVDPQCRRTGLATAVSAAMLRWAVREGARRAYLQVVADNGAAIALWQRLGFAQHHGYLYRTGRS